MGDLLVCKCMHVCVYVYVCGFGVLLPHTVIHKSAVLTDSVANIYIDENLSTG